MSPGNDNFGNALGILANEYEIGSNVDATSEVGEPPNNGKTVWWVFTPKTSGIFIISTRACDAINVANITTATPPFGFTNFYSKIQVFTGSAVNALAEVQYLWNFSQVKPPNPGMNIGDIGFFSYDFVGSEFADACAFQAVGGTSYYIRVDSRNPNIIPLQGTIALTVKTCPLGIAPGTGGLNVVRFGNYFPPGNYTVHYVGGAFIVAINSWASLNWGGGSGTPDPYGNNEGYYVVYNNGANAVGFSTPATGYPTADQAQSAAAGAKVSFVHTGGYIGVEFVDTLYSDNIPGNPSPTFYLASSCGSDCGQSPTIASAALNCTGNNVLDVLLNVPQGIQAAVYKITLSNVVGFSVLNKTIDFAPVSYTPGYSAASFYVTTPPFNTAASATITLTDANGDVCSTYNFSISPTSGLQANGSNIVSAANGLFSGTFNIELQSNYPCSQINNCSVTLEATGGVVSPSAKVNGVTFAAGQSTAIPFNFQSDGSETLTATLNVFSSTGGQIASIQFELSANLAINSISSGSAARCLPSAGCEGASISITNNGLLPSYDTQVLMENSCTFNGGFQTDVVDIGVINPGQTLNVTIPFYILGVSCVGRSTSVTANLQQVAPGGQTYAFPSFTFNNYCGCPE